LLHKNLGVAAGKPIPANKLSAAKNSSSAAVRKRATFAENAKGWVLEALNSYQIGFGKGVREAIEFEHI
jgi:hypothetical protein